MPNISMLPKTSPNDPIVKAVAGQWQTNTSIDFLSKLAQSLEVAEAPNLEFISSIPDVWARPLLFKMALFGIGDAHDKNSDLAKGITAKVIGEWRSILAMFALKDIKKVNLKAEYIDLAQDNSKIAQVLRALVPKESFNGDVNAWLTGIYVIYFNGKPIAMTSPLTLVSSAADYVSKFNGTIPMPWSNNGKYLTDPISGLQFAEREALNRWLNDLQEKISKAADHFGVNDISQKLMNLLHHYSKDLDCPAVNMTYTLTSSNLNLHKGIAHFLDETIEGAGAAFVDSQVRLLTNNTRSDKKILLVSPKMVREFADQEHINPAELVVWSGINANDVNEKSLRLNERNKIGAIYLKSKDGNVEYRCPEDFFYERMAVIEPGNSFPGSLNNNIAGITVLADTGVTPILPIKTELLEYFTPAEIAANMSFEEDEDNIYVYFNFPLSGKAGSSKYRYCKVYSVKDLIYIQNDVPTIEIWPNLQIKNWNKYYLYYENYYKNAGNPDELANDIYYVKPYVYGREIGKDFKTGGHEGKLNKFVSKLEVFPEALICSYKSLEERESIFEVGIVLMDKKLLAAPKNAPPSTWNIGVDFGTSSTMLYFREKASAPHPLVLQPRLFKVTESGGARAQLLENFIPDVPYKEDGSFLSIFHLFNFSGTVESLIDGHVFMLKSDNAVVFERLKRDIDANLKWKGDQHGKAKTAAYIGQICLQALVEAAAENVTDIIWNFSYPTAFSAVQQMTFETTCGNAVADAYNNTGYVYDKNKISSWSESQASAYYFNTLQDKGKGAAPGMAVAKLANGAMCVDIGAGTTDITVISDQPGRIVYHTSIQFAGRYMFKPIYDNYQLFVEEKTAEIISKISLENLEQRSAIMDAAMRENSENYIKNLGFKAEQEDVRAVLQGSQFAMAGLFWYLGKLLGRLHENNHYTENNLPRIFVGGNGSRIFKWLTAGNDIKNNKFLTVLENMLVTASGLNKNTHFYLDLSHQPKVEVASGMISNKPANHEDFFNEDRIKSDLFGANADAYIANSVIAGAEFIEDGKVFAADEFMNAHDVCAGINVTSIDEFQYFIKKFNSSEKLWFEGIPLDEESVEDLIRETNAYFVSEKAQNVKDIFLEPVFIVELKNLMEMLDYGI